MFALSAASHAHAVVTPLRRRSGETNANRRVTTVVHASSDASSQKAELAEMRREVQLKSMQPSQANVVNSIIDLAQQEFGLAGE